MLKTIILAASTAVIVLTTAPAGAQTVIERRTTTDVVPDSRVIIRDRTGSVDIDDEDCVKTKTTRTDAVTGDRETRVRKDCD